MTTKLKILGPYTPEHPGPFCTRDGRAARIISTDRRGAWPILALIEADKDEDVYLYPTSGRYGTSDDNSLDLMNAEEVPVAREFWINEYTDGQWYVHTTEESAISVPVRLNFLRTIHVREVRPGDDQ